MKPWYKSRTIIINLLTLAAGLTGVFVGTEWIMANPALSALTLSVTAVLNVHLRLMTGKTIG